MQKHRLILISSVYIIGLRSGNARKQRVSHLPISSSVDELEFPILDLMKAMERAKRGLSPPYSLAELDKCFPA